MRAIILAAGMGTRLRPITDKKPKSLVEVAGEAMTERQVRFLKDKGINDSSGLPERCLRLFS